MSLVPEPARPAGGALRGEGPRGVPLLLLRQDPGARAAPHRRAPGGLHLRRVHRPLQHHHQRAGVSPAGGGLGVSSTSHSPGGAYATVLGRVRPAAGGPVLRLRLVAGALSAGPPRRRSGAPAGRVGALRVRPGVGRQPAGDRRSGGGAGSGRSGGRRGRTAPGAGPPAHPPGSALDGGPAGLAPRRPAPSRPGPRPAPTGLGLRPPPRHRPAGAGRSAGRRRGPPGPPPAAAQLRPPLALRAPARPTPERYPGYNPGGGASPAPAGADSALRRGPLLRPLRRPAAAPRRLVARSLVGHPWSADLLLLAG